jgi:D-aminoacyl-tRNA deacylase
MVNPHYAIKLYDKPLNRKTHQHTQGNNMILIVHSTRDIAGVNIAQQIHNQIQFTKTNQIYQENPVYTASINNKQVTHVTLKEEAVNAQTLPNNFPNTKLIIFLSRHSSQSGTPTLSVHTPGNIGKAELGGLQSKVSVAPATAMQTALQTLNRQKHDKHLNYEVSYECTHHGPSLNVPTMFVELGSSETQWRDTNAANAVAQATIQAIAEFGTLKPAVIGIGGTHYNQKFTRMALENKAAFGHMIPKYAIPELNSEILHQCMEKTLEKVEAAILDWKGIRSEDKPNLLTTLKEADLPIKKA